MVLFEDIQKANAELKGVIHRTPLVYSRTFSSISGNDIFLKTENLQKTGSFKIRGAFHKICSLNDEEKTKGVIAASAGNHAQGVAYAASAQGLKSTVVMPQSTPVAKITATKRYGAEVILHGNGYDDAYRKALEIKNSTDKVLVHAFDDPFVIAGQGTIGIEMLEEKSDLDILVVPVGGGGLISGVALAAKTLKPGIKVIGVEVKGFDAMRKSLDEGEIVSVNTANTIADGIAVRRPGDITFSMVKAYVDDIVTVSDDEVSEAILMILERSKYIAEGAGAVSLAAVLDKKIVARNKKMGVIISGGNIDINLVSMIIHKGLLKSGRKLEAKTILRDTPGQLRNLLDLIAGAKANIISIHHNRDRIGMDLGYAEVDMVLETRDRDHSEELCRLLKAKGYPLVIED